MKLYVVNFFSGNKGHTCMNFNILISKNYSSFVIQVQGKSIKAYYGHNEKSAKMRKTRQNSKWKQQLKKYKVQHLKKVISTAITNLACFSLPQLLLCGVCSYMYCLFPFTHKFHRECTALVVFVSRDRTQIDYISHSCLLPVSISAKN